LCENEKNEKVDLKRGRKFIFENFDKDVDLRTVCNYFMEACLSSRLMRVPSGGFELNLESLAELYRDTLNTYRDQHLLEDTFWVIDCTYDSHRTDTHRTYAPRGSKQPILNKKYSQYTNCFVVAACSDPYEPVRVRLYTYDKELSKDSSDIDYLSALLEHYEIHDDQIVYIPAPKKKGKKKGDKKTYCRETCDIISNFLDWIDLPRGTVVFTDEGNCFFHDGQSIVSDKHLEHHTFPSKIHQLLSPIDEGINGHAKRKWKTECKDFSDRVKAPLKLLYYLENIPIEDVETYFEWNFCLDKERVETDDCLKVIKPLGKNEILNSFFYNECRDAYKEAILGIDRTYKEGVPENLQSRLDGTYWV